MSGSQYPIEINPPDKGDYAAELRLTRNASMLQYQATASRLVRVSLAHWCMERGVEPWLSSQCGYGGAM